jgi:hypothetical protein
MEQLSWRARMWLPGFGGKTCSRSRACHNTLADSVMATLIGPDFDPQQQSNGTLMYNLACLYALEGDKPRLSQSAAVARRLGKPGAQFMAD